MCLFLYVKAIRVFVLHVQHELNGFIAINGYSQLKFCENLSIFIVVFLFCVKLTKSSQMLPKG
jgi:hypothetical protein